MNDVLVIKNFFNIFVQKQLLQIVKDTAIKWTLFENPSLGHNNYTNNALVEDSLTFGYISYHKNKKIENQYSSYFLKLFKSQILKYLNVNIDIIRIQISLIPPNPNYNSTYMPPHVDFTIPHKTLIYYLNDNDADTFLFNETSFLTKETEVTSIYDRITPKQGQACIFNGNRYHAASPSKFTTRIIINVNFVEIS